MNISIDELLNIEELDTRAIFEGGLSTLGKPLQKLRILFLNTQKSAR